MKYKAEAFDLWQYLCREVYEPLIRCRIDFDSFIDLDTLKKALTASIKALPILGCAFDAARLKPHWLDRGFTGADMVRLVTAEAGSEEAEILRCFSVGIDTAAGPLLKIFIVRSPGGDTICLLINHMLCDGAGLKEYLYLLSKLYTQLITGEPLTVPASLPRGIKPLFADYSIKDAWQLLRNKDSSNDMIDGASQCGVDLQEGAPVTAIERRIISAGALARLKGFAKTQGTTFNDAMMALFARSFCKNSGTNKIIFPSTIDLRRFIPQDQIHGISNYSGNCMCRVSVRPQDTLTDTILQISQQMRAHKNGHSALKSTLEWYIMVHLPWFILKKSFTKYIMQPIITYTNVGIIDEQQLVFDGVKIKDAYLTASIKPRPYLQMSACTYDGHCVLGCNIYGSEADQRFVIQLFDDICAEIDALV